MLYVNHRIQIPLREFEFTFVRSSGPGGQNVNKVNSKAVMRWNIQNSPALPDDVRKRFMEQYGRRVTLEGDLLITSQRFRDQGRNTGDCLEKLRVMLLENAQAPKTRKATKPSKGSQRRRLEDKRQTSAKKSQRRSPGRGDD